MEKQISIIIPTYNMEKYIGKCLDSLLTPEFEQVEVLVVNDGSKDRSSEIAHGYADRYPGSIRVIDKPNGNYGSCINAALPLATGRYVKVLDADDTFDTETFSDYVRMLPNIDDDAIITGFCQVDENGTIIKTTVSTLDSSLTDRSMKVGNVEVEELIRSSLMHKITYRCDVFDRFDYVQSEGISYTDTEWAIIPMARCKTIRFIDNNLYRYLVGRDGQTMNSASIRRNYRHLSAVGQKLVNYTIAYDGESSMGNFLIERLKAFYEFYCTMALSVWNTEIADEFKMQDEYLAKCMPMIYSYIGTIPYDAKMKFRVFEDIRKKNYHGEYRVPVIVRIGLSLYMKLSGLFRSKQS